jgi:hypothetical protein
LRLSPKVRGLKKIKGSINGLGGWFVSIHMDHFVVLIKTLEVI